MSHCFLLLTYERERPRLTLHCHNHKLHRGCGNAPRSAPCNYRRLGRNLCNSLVSVVCVTTRARSGAPGTGNPGRASQHTSMPSRWRNTCQRSPLSTSHILPMCSPSRIIWPNLSASQGYFGMNSIFVRVSCSTNGLLAQSLRKHGAEHAPMRHSSRARPMLTPHSCWTVVRHRRERQRLGQPAAAIRRALPATASADHEPLTNGL